MSDDFNAKLLKLAEERVGKEAVMKDGYGKDCFVLVDMLLRQIGAATAADGDVPVTPTADYDWGDNIIDITPGDILQFNKHKVYIVTETYDEDDKLRNTEKRWLTRPHHTAIVAEVHKDGSVTVIEQNVSPKEGTVTKNLIPLLEGSSTKTVKHGKGEQKITMKVTGSVKYWRATTKPEKSSSLSPTKSSPGRGSLALTGIVTSTQSGAKRPPGVFG
jgi:hypothetical protein